MKNKELYNRLSEKLQKLQEENEPTNPALWSRAKAAAKAKYDVYPSAYANAFASKWYKEKGGGWKAKSESVNEAKPQFIKVKDTHQSLANGAMKHMDSFVKKMQKSIERGNKFEISTIVKMRNILNAIENQYGIKESTPDQVIKDLDKAKNDLLKKVDALIAKKKKLYSDVDIEAPMSANEKKLDKDIADLFSQINKLVLQKRSVKKESVNEKFDNTHLGLLKYAYKDIDKINPADPMYKRVVVMLDKLSKQELKQIADADIKFLSLLAKNRLMKTEGDEMNDPQEITVGNYKTRYFDVCPGASNLYKDIESKGVDVNMAVRSAKLQDVLFFIEKHIQRPGYNPSTEYLFAAKNIASEIMKLAKMMNLESEHNYIQGHIDTIAKVVGGESVNESPKFKITNTITKKDWAKTHKDYKSIIDGVPYVMKMTDSGTALVPVKIVESVNESHFQVGDKVKMSHGGVGIVKSLDKEDGADDEKYYNIELPNGDVMKHAPNELTLAETNLGEGLFQNLMKGVKKGNGPFTLVVIKNNKVVKQVNVNTPQAIPANYTSLQKDYPNSRIRIEDSTGKIVFGEASDAEEKDFHMKLDKLVHSTFGKSPDEKKNESIVNESSVEIGDFVFLKSANKIATVIDRMGRSVTVRTADGKKIKTIINNIKTLAQDNVNEGNAFTGALFKARKEGLAEFEFNGKMYPVHKLEEEETPIKESKLSKNDLKKIIKEEYHNVKNFMEEQYGFVPEFGKVYSNLAAKPFLKEEEEEVIEEYDVENYQDLKEFVQFMAEYKADINEAEYQGRKVKLGKIMQGDVKKFKVYVRNDKGNVVKVNFGQGGDAKGGTMRIRKDNPKARASFRARHNCDNPGPRWKARYWSCKKW
jgi:hypothetical protein